MGGTDEQPESTGGGDHSERAGVQLSEAQNGPVQESAVEAESPEPTVADVDDGWLPLGNEDSTPFVNEQTGQFEQMSLMDLFSEEMEQINHIDEA